MTKQKDQAEQALANPAYLAGKLHYWEGVPSDAINHCSPDIVTAWLAGWNDAKAEHMQLRSQITGDGRVLSERRTDILS